MVRIICFLCISTQLLPAQSVAFSDPGRPGFVKLQQTNGTITVRGYSGSAVMLEERNSHSHGVLPKVTISEEGNRMTIKAQPNSGITLQVPYQTSLQLNASNGSIVVENVKGELDAQTTNGSVVVRGAAGAVVAHSHNGSINVTFEKVDARRPMSFTSFNGRIDVAFPADLKASLKVQVDRGSVHSDFDLLMKGGTAGKQFSANINGGGAEMQFKNYNGSVYLRKAALQNK